MNGIEFDRSSIEREGEEKKNTSTETLVEKGVENETRRIVL